MPEPKDDANDFDTRADEFLAKEGTDTPEAPSAETKPEDTETTASETTTAEVDKTEKVKEVEADASLSVEDKIAKIKEILGEDEKAIDAYIKQKGYHNDPAWQKQRELIEKLRKESAAQSALSKEDKAALDEFKTFRSSPDYIRQSMKAQGYTQDAIDKKLKESGFDVSATPQDDVKMVVEKMGLKFDDLSTEDKTYVSEVVRIADAIFNDRLGKTLPKQLQPIQEHIGDITKKEGASKLMTTIKETVKTEGILDFDKDIDPALNKFLDDNPDATQQDVLEHFKNINHSLTVERLKTGKKKEERDDKRTNLRQNIPLVGTKTAPKRTGNFDADADAFFESANVAD